MQSYTNRIEYDGVMYQINDKEKTASVLKTVKISGKIIIPCSVFFGSDEYTVKSILKNSLLNIDPVSMISIQFANNSKIATIEDGAFAQSNILEIEIPPSLVELQDGWCMFTQNLNRIKILENNPRYTLYENKFIFGKSSQDQTSYDELIFAVRNIETATIPPFIKHICPFAFQNCEKLRKIEFPDDSQVQTIGKNAFSFTALEKFIIPPHLMKISEFSFYYCKKLQKIDVSTDSELHTIEKYAFASSELESMAIPPSLIELEDKWCYMLPHLAKIKIINGNPRYILHENKFIFGKSSQSAKNHDELVFAMRDIEKAIIPSGIKRICPYSFELCKNLHQIEFPIDSELQTIDESAFSFSGIESINIPPKLFQLKNGWCNGLYNLTNVIVLPNNKHFLCLDNKLIIGKSSQSNDFYDELVFAARDIKTAIIPGFIKRICSYAFSRCTKLRKVEISCESNLEVIDDNAFESASIKKIKIPRSLKLIGNHAFANCKKLREIEFSADSELQIIGEYSFVHSSIKRFTIPPHLSQICEKAFFLCLELQNVDISSNSELKRISSDAFYGSRIKSILLPSYFSQSIYQAFAVCHKLQIVEFEENNEQESIDVGQFKKCQNAVLMIPPKLKTLSK